MDPLLKYIQLHLRNKSASNISYPRPLRLPFVIGTCFPRDECIEIPCIDATKI